MKTVFKVLCILVLIMFTALQSYAIPAFARKNRFSCKTCHSPFPRLNEFGEEFAGNGFEIPEGKASRYFVDVGDDQLQLIRDLPIAFRFEGFITQNNGDSGKFDFTSPYLLKFLSGGPLSDNISYYFYFFMDERGDVAGLEDAFFHFNNIFNSELDIIVGQFQVSDPLFKRELRLSYDDYMIYKATPGESESSLTYDRGIMFTYGFKTGTDLVFEVLNGNGIDEADHQKNYDTDKEKNYLGRISQSIGDHFRVGAFGYSGSEKNSEMMNDISIFGVDCTFSWDKKVELNIQYVERTDDNPYFTVDPLSDIETKGGFAELVVTPFAEDSKWYFTGLYNWIDSDQEDLTMKSFTVHAGRMYKRNMRFTAEVTYVFDSLVYDDHARLLLGFVSAF